ncbi:MAG: DNA polymerase III subunit delta' [Patescibacteria group bacterium]
MKNYNWGIIGHQKISQFLQKSLDNNKLAHAYLLAGPEHLGKSLLAENFMASILCQDYHANSGLKAESLPCGKCIFCDQLKKGIHPDVYFLKKEEEKKNISVEQVREMQKFLYLTSFLNSYKIALVEHAEDLSESAQNALLKVLEEPWPKTILILICRDANLLLPTIISRCQVFKFLPISTDETYHYLIELGATREQARIYSALACGQIGVAVNFLHNPEAFKIYLEKTTQLLELFSAKLTDKFKLIENLLANFDNHAERLEFLCQELNAWQILARDLIFVQNNLNNLVTNVHFQEQLAKLAGINPAAKLASLIEKISRVKQILAYNINPRLAVENLIINM